MKYIAAVAFLIIWALTTLALGALLFFPLIVVVETSNWADIPERLVKVFEK
jgi:hypothetical protein